MSNIKVLDCTLRDGGYVNNWDFGYKNIQKILTNLINANLDYIECGFLKPLDYNENKSLFSKISDFGELLASLNNGRTKFTLMINYGEYDIDNIPICTCKNIALRIVFKKEQRLNALKYCRLLKDKGYSVFVNPMHTNTYSSYELLELVKAVNELRPEGFTIVDTTGAMREKDILTAFYIVNSTLDKDIALCFHSHNNLQLSFSNAQCLMKVCKDRELIIDSTVFGMGRGAGNLCTELITQYINDNYGGHYDIIPILKIVDEQINPIFAKTPWGYSVPYYLAATNHCHPNYAKYLVDKQTVPVEFINNLLQSIPDNKKSIYDVNLIKQLYLDKFSKAVDDSKTVEYMKNILSGKKILILAPGKSLKEEKERVDNFIERENPFIISLNFIPEQYRENLVFVTNLKRFTSLNDYSGPLVVSSNIENIPPQAFVLNYSSYLNDSKMFDNVALMLLKLLIKINIKYVSIAGFDGFSPVATDNYVSNDLINNARLSEFDERNDVMSEEIGKLSEKIDINFITSTMYNIKPVKIRHPELVSGSN